MRFVYQLTDNVNNEYTVWPANIDFIIRIKSSVNGKAKVSSELIIAVGGEPRAGAEGT